MRALTYVFAAVALAGLASAHAQSTSGAQTPARQSTTSAPAATPAQPTTPSNAEQTVRPPDSRRTTDQNDRATNSVKNRANNPQRVPPTSRGVGPTNNRPDCSKLRGLEKSECERRDTSRDDLPAGVTTTQPEK